MSGGASSLVRHVACGGTDMRQRTRVAALLVALLSALMCVDRAGAFNITFTEPPDDTPGATINVGVDAALLPVSITMTTSSTAETGHFEIVFSLPEDSIVTNQLPRPVAALLEPGSTLQAPVV